MVKNRILSQNP